MPSTADHPTINVPPVAVPRPPLAWSVPALPAELPGDVAGLVALLETQQQAFQDALQTAVAQVADTRAAHAYLIRMIEQAKLARHRLYGASSEQVAAQGHLFDEAEALAQQSSAAQDTAPLPPAAADAGRQPAGRLGRGKRGPLAATLPRVAIVHEVPAEQRTCSCGTPMVVIGEEASEQLDIVPMRVRVLRHVRKRYGCPGGRHAPRTAALPPQPLPKSNASANFLAMLLVAKFLDGLPLARFEHVLARHHAVVPRQTLARWVIGAATLLQPLHT